ncbi:MAG: hypothetical protein J2P31_21490, partial [Blastocatellia bacterium]|nr:hypothetical protein [Blastocatellia bacterium]
MAANLAHALSHLYGPDSVAVLVTDWSGFVVRLIFPENVFNSYPRGVPILNIVALRQASSHERERDLMTALMNMRPDMVINVNSRAMWECYERFAPELAEHMRLGTVAFLHPSDKAGKPIGYTATHLERLLPFLDFVITDNAHIVEELRQLYIAAPRTERVATESEWGAAKLVANLLAKQSTPTELDASDVAKFHCLYQYTTPATRLPGGPVRSRSGRPQVLWASRVSRLKFPELLPHIARMVPECDIQAFGARE